MDCRKTLGLGLSLLIGAAGCTHQTASAPVLPPAQAANASAPIAVDSVPANAVVKKEADLPMRAPHARTCVAAGDYCALEAAAPEVTDTFRQQKREQARRSYQQALTIDPHNLPAYLSLAQLYIDMKDHDHAIATYRKACQLFPNEPRVFFDLGGCYGGEKEWELAIPALTRAVELDPENRPFVDKLGWMQARAGRFDESLKTFRKVHDEAESNYRLALMLDHLHQTDKCRQLLQTALAKDPQLEGARALLAKVNSAPAAPPLSPEGKGEAVQPAAYTESAKPTAPAPAIPTAVIQPTIVVQPVPAIQPPSAPQPNLAPAARGVLLPPPPRISIHYENPAAPPEAGAGAPMVK